MQIFRNPAARGKSVQRTKNTRGKNWGARPTASEENQPKLHFPLRGDAKKQGGEKKKGTGRLEKIRPFHRKRLETGLVGSKSKNGKDKESEVEAGSEEEKKKAC